MKDIKFYILIPVYNVEQYLDACLASILSQDYSEYEIVLVDDGSKDSSGEICDRYAAENENIHVIHQQNSGQISARLAAINFVQKNADIQGTYSIFVDSDDELMPGALKAMNGKITSSGCDMLIYGYERFNSDGVYYTTVAEKAEEMLVCDMGSLFREAVIEHNYNSLCRKAIKTEMLFADVEEHIKGIQIGEDLLQSLYLYRQSPRTLITPDILYRYRTNPTSITQTFKIKRFTDELMSRYYTVKMIEELDIWSNNDFDRYFDNSLTVLQWDIRKILLESPSRKDTLNNLKQIHENPFVREYCLDRISNKSDVWLREFAKRHFKTLLLLHKISRIKNSFKEKRKK